MYKQINIICANLHNLLHPLRSSNHRSLPEMKKYIFIISNFYSPYLAVNLFNILKSVCLFEDYTPRQTQLSRQFAFISSLLHEEYHKKANR